MSETSSFPPPHGLAGRPSSRSGNALKIRGFAASPTWTVAVVVRFTLPRLSPRPLRVYNSPRPSPQLLRARQPGHRDLRPEESRSAPITPPTSSAAFSPFASRSAPRLLAAMASPHFRGRPPEVAAWLILRRRQFSSSATPPCRCCRRDGTVDGSRHQTARQAALGRGILVALTAAPGCSVWPAPLPCGSGSRPGALLSLCRRHLSLRLRIDLAATRRVIVCSFPFFVTTLRTTLFSKLDDTLLASSPTIASGLVRRRLNLSQLALLMTPLVARCCCRSSPGWRRRSQGELDHVMRRSLEVILMVAIPQLALGLGAESGARRGGPDYGPAALSLRILAPSSSSPTWHALRQTALIEESRARTWSAWWPAPRPRSARRPHGDMIRMSVGVRTRVDRQAPRQNPGHAPRLSPM